MRWDIDGDGGGWWYAHLMVLYFSCDIDGEGEDVIGLETALYPYFSFPSGDILLVAMLAELARRKDGKRGY